MVRGIARLPSNKPGSKRFVGWVSEHTPAPSTIHLWETSQVLLFLAHYVLMLQQHLAQTTLQRANLSVKVSGLKRPDSWLETTPSVGLKHNPQKYWTSVKREYEALLGFNPSSEYRIYRRIYENYIVPWASFSKGKLIKSDRHVSMLLYGPPGTAKTTLAHKIAEGLEYPLIEITPSDFIGGGEKEVEARAKAIFKSLEEQSEVVIFFDEIDRMILDRDSKLYLDQSDVFQFMTPGMLTKLKDLYDKRRSIFIIATNLAERIDKAAKRQGRIDDRYLVLPPDKIKRFDILEALFKKYQKNISEIPENWLSTVMKKVADKTALFVFGELDHLVHSVAHEVNDKTDSAWMRKFEARILEKVEKIEPTITLTSYLSRFRATAKKRPEDFPTVQEPYEEFFLLVKLILEVRDFLPEEKDMVGKIVHEFEGNPLTESKDHPPTKQQVTEKILKQVKDESVKGWLINKLTKLRLCA
jgi:SpoVK/Ycf46/Vps4 family AAA+-type ATPase